MMHGDEEDHLPVVITIILPTKISTPIKNRRVPNYDRKGFLDKEKLAKSVDGKDDLFLIKFKKKHFLG